MDKKLVAPKFSWLQVLKKEPLNALMARKGVFEIWVSKTSKTLHKGHLNSIIFHTHTGHSQDSKQYDEAANQTKTQNIVYWRKHCFFVFRAVAAGDGVDFTTA